MIRNLKTLGLALVAVLALSAIAASAASATNGELTGSSIHGEGIGASSHRFTGGSQFGCGSVTYEGEVTSTTILGLTPEFYQCEFPGGAPMTITHNGCYYRLHVGTKINVDDSEATVDLVCPNGPLVMHIYQNAAHTQDACTIEIGNQTGLTGLTIEDETNESLFIHGEVPGIHSFLTGPCVGGATITNPAGLYTLDLELTVEGPGLTIH